MRIVFDGHYWNSGPPSGKMVLRQMVSTWSSGFPDDRLALATKQPPTDEESIRIIRRIDNLYQTKISLHPLSNRTELRLIARQFGADWTITQNFSSGSAHDAVFIHDMIYRDHPEWFTPRERIYLKSIGRLAKSSAICLTSSQTEAQRISRLYPSLGQVHAVGLASSPSLVSASPKRPDIGNVRPGKYLLSVGRLNARKNIERLTSALWHNHIISPELPLIIVGSTDGRQGSKCEALTEGLLVGAIRTIGNVSDAELSWLYTNCQAFVYPSLDEGFGLPPVEARAMGAPVVVSDLQIFRETLGTEADSSAVAFCNPKDEADIARAVKHQLILQPRIRTDGPAADTWLDVVKRIRETLVVNDAIVSQTGGGK